MRTTRRMLLICGVALVNVLSTLLPVWPMRYQLLAHRLPWTLISGAQHITLFTGIAMLLLAYPAAQSHRKAAQLLMLCAGVAVIANVVKGLDVEEALINAILLSVLWRGRQALHSIPLRYTVVDLLRLGLALLVLAKVYDISGKAILNGLRVLADRGRIAFPWAHRLIHILTAKLPLEHIWFDQSQSLLPVFLIGIFLGLSWTSLFQAKTGSDSCGDLYDRFGRKSHNSLAYLARRNDVSTFLHPLGLGAVTYRQVGRVALQVGAILAPPGARQSVYEAFHDYCREQRLIPAAVALTEDERAIARACGMRTLTIGTEAMVDLGDFAVDKLAKKLRWAQRSLTKRGFTVRVLSAADVSAQQRIALDSIDNEWRDNRGGQLHGCCMTLGRFPTHADSACRIGIAFGPDGLPVAYLTLLPGGEGYYSLDLTRRSHSAPNAIMEYLMIEVLSSLQQQGATTVSLNFSTFSSLASTRTGNALLRLAGKAVQLGSLEAFNAKFRPSWSPRYLACPSWFALPDVVYAILVVEGVDRMAANALARGIRRFSHPASAGRVAPRWQSEVA